MNEKPKGQRPDFKFAVKEKATGARLYWGAGWRTGQGVNVALDKRARLFIDDVEITSDKFYLDMFEGEYIKRNPKPKPAAVVFGRGLSARIRGLWRKQNIECGATKAVRCVVVAGTNCRVATNSQRMKATANG